MQIENIIKEHMEDCLGFNVYFCEYYELCIDCSLLNENIRLEWYKEQNICYHCAGHSVISRQFFSNGWFGSVSRTCNVCGGSGKYIQRMEE